MQEWTVERTDDVKFDVGGIFGHKLDDDALWYFVGHYLPFVNHAQTMSGMVDDGAFPHAIDTAEDVDVGLQLPDDVLSSLPQGFDFDALNVVSSFFHAMFGLYGCAVAVVRHPLSYLYVAKIAKSWES